MAERAFVCLFVESWCNIKIRNENISMQISVIVVYIPTRNFYNTLHFLFRFSVTETEIELEREEREAIVSKSGIAYCLSLDLWSKLL